VAQRDLFSENQLLHLQTIKEFNCCMDLMGEFAVRETTRSPILRKQRAQAVVPELGAQEQEEWQNGGWKRWCGSTGGSSASPPTAPVSRNDGLAEPLGVVSIDITTADIPAPVSITAVQVQVTAQVSAPASPSPLGGAIVTASTEKLATVRRSAPVELDESTAITSRELDGDRAGTTEKLATDFAEKRPASKQGSTSKLYKVKKGTAIKSGSGSNIELITVQNQKLDLDDETNRLGHTRVKNDALAETAYTKKKGTARLHPTMPLQGSYSVQAPRANRLGIQFEERTKGQANGVTVKLVRDTSPLLGQLHVNHVLLAINGQNVLNETMEGVVRTLRAGGDRLPLLTLIPASGLNASEERQEEPNSSDDRPAVVLREEERKKRTTEKTVPSMGQRCGQRISIADSSDIINPIHELDARHGGNQKVGISRFMPPNPRKISKRITNLVAKSTTISGLGCGDAGGKWNTNIIGGGGKKKENASIILLNWWTECMANAAQQLDVAKAECPVDDTDTFELKDVLDADQQVIGHLLWGLCRITPSALLTLLISGYPHSHFSPADPSASAANSPSLFVSPSAEFRHPP
jgi:hypothetical protein